MGPCTFTDLDSRPDDDAHNQDWMKNVDPFVERYCESGYWRRNDELSYAPEELQEFNLVDMMFFKISKGQRYRFDNLIHQVIKAYKYHKSPYLMNYYESQMARGDAPEIVVAWYFDKWAYFDRFEEFQNEYEEVHGEGSWATFWKEYNNIVEYDMDEIMEIIK
jgi:hypothetical protein